MRCLTGRYRAARAEEAGRHLPTVGGCAPPGSGSQFPTVGGCANPESRLTIPPAPHRRLRTLSGMTIASGNLALAGVGAP